MPPDDSADRSRGHQGHQGIDHAQEARRDRSSASSSPQGSRGGSAKDHAAGIPEHWPVLARLGAVPRTLWQARLQAAPRRALVVAASLQATLLAVFAFISAMRPYDGLWLRLAAATWVLWLWPLAGFVAQAVRTRASSTRLRASRTASLAAVAEELDRHNPGAPDIFRTALRPEAHAPATRDALERLYAHWEPRLQVPGPPRLFGRDRGGVARRCMAGVAVLSVALVLTASVWLPALLVTSPLNALNAPGGGPGSMLVRMLLPLRVLAAIPAPRLTPDVLPAVMARGDTLVVTVAVDHVPPHQSVYAHVRARTGGADADVRYELAPIAGERRGFGHEDQRPRSAAPRDNAERKGRPDRREFRFGPVTQAFTIRFTTLRAATRPHAVDVVAPPAITSLSAVVTPPSYTRLPPETHDPFPAHLAVLPGTRIAWSGAVDRPLARWTAQWKDERDEMDETHQAGDAGAGGAGEGGGEAAEPHTITFAGGEGQRLAFTRTVRAAGTLGLSLTDHAARGAGRSLAGPWRVDVRPDQPPEIVLLAPAADGELPRSLKVSVGFRATDDFGISALRLHSSLRDAHGVVKASAQRDVTAWRDLRDGRGSGVWDGAAADAFPVAPVAGESVEFYLEALDNNAVRGPARTRSATVRLRLPSLEEARETLSERERAATTGLSSALEREKRREREAARPDRAAAAEAMMPATEWDVRRVLSEAPRRHAQELRRQVAAELELARARNMADRASRDDRPSAAERRSPQQHDSGKTGPAPSSSQQVAKLEALQRKAEELERRLPSPDAARAPTEEQRALLESLRADQRELERALAAAPASRPLPPSAPPAPSSSSPESARREAAQAERQARAEQAARDNRGRLEDELKANQREQEQLQGWLNERQRMETAEQARREAAARQAGQAREDLENALQQMEQAMRTGLEDGTLTPDILEKMDRVRELLQEVLDEREMEEWERAARGETPTSDDLRRALDDMKRPGGMREDLEQAIRMLESVRDLRELQALAGDLRGLEEEQRALAREMAAEAVGQEEQQDPTTAASKTATQDAVQDASQDAKQAARQEELAKRLEQSLRNMEQLANKPSMNFLPRESVRKPSQDALRRMQDARAQLQKKNPDRERSRQNANLAAQKLDAAAAELEKALAQAQRGEDKAEMREVVEETLEFTRWLDGMDLSETFSEATAGAPHFAWNVETSREDAQSFARVARWLAGRMDKLAAARAFESDVLRRSAASMVVHADALATQGSRAALAEVGRHARNGARELLKWLSQENEGGGSDEGEGQGDNDFGGGEQGQGEEGTQGMARRMRGASGQQMAANRMTQELLRSLMEQRQEGRGGESAPDPSGRGRRGGPESSGHGQPENAGGDRNGQAAGGTGHGERQAGAEGGRSGSGSGRSAQEGNAGSGSGNRGDVGDPRADGHGAAANAQQRVADELESLAERADDAGGASRTLRRLAEEARELERALREGRLDPEEIRKRQERFHTRLLQSADAMEERGHREERRAEVWAGGPTAVDGRTALPADSLAAELKRRRENARRLPLTPEQKRRVEWYYERLLRE